MQPSRLFDLLYYQQANFPQDDCLVRKENGTWNPLSTSEVIDQVNLVSLGLKELGIEKDDKVAIISMNRPEWNIVDLGIQQLGAVGVPMYPNITVEDYSFIFKDAGVKIVFVADEDLFDKVNQATQGLDIQAVYTFDQVSGAKHWSEVKQLGDGKDVTVLEPLKAAVQPDDLLTLIYTSGTTGNPKGVMLTHHNVISNIEAVVPLVPVNQEHMALSFLPLCHIFERMLVGVYFRLGVSVYYAESMDTIGDNLRELKPHFFTAVPRLLEKVYDRIYAKGQELKGIKRTLFFWALKIASQYEMDTNQGGFYNWKLNLANKLIFSKWREALGGNVIAVTSGSAALQPRLAKIFWAARIHVLQGYGLTETSPVVATNQMQEENHRIGSVGPVIDGVEVKIADDGEILVKGPNVMVGYYNNPEATAEVLKDGWLHTGDIGEFQEGRFLKITDRKKEMFKTSGGKYIAPQVIENKFKESTFIEQIMVVGEGQKFPGALIVPSFEMLKEYCAHKGVDYTTDAEMVAHELILDKYQREVDHFNEGFGSWEKIKRFRVIPNEWTIDTGELTPTMKCKRKNIKAKYASYIEDIYNV